MKKFRFLYLLLLAGAPFMLQAQSARFQGTASYTIDFTKVSAQLSIDEIVNIHLGKTTGPLKVQLYLCNDAYDGGSIKGYACGEAAVSEGITGIDSISKIHTEVGFTQPPNGSYYPVILLFEKTKSEEFIIDYITFEAVQISKKSTGTLTSAPL